MGRVGRSGEGGGYRLREPPVTLKEIGHSHTASGKVQSCGPHRKGSLVWGLSDYLNHLIVVFTRAVRTWRSSERPVQDSIFWVSSLPHKEAAI